MAKNKNTTDLFGDEVQTPAGKLEDFESMFAATIAAEELKVGGTFEGEILSIGKEESFLSTGGAVDAQIPSAELKDKDGKLLFSVGDKIRVKVIRMRESEIRVKRLDSVGSASDEVESLEDAFDLELPVKGRVLEAVKGGFRVEIQNQKAFCPLSQIDLRNSNEASEYVGKTFEFIITQFESRNLVVSRRKLLDLQKAEGEGAFLLSKKPGDRLKGRITKLETFGAFCRMDDGVEGLIPISELAWGRVSHPSEVLRVGQDVEVVLLRVQEEGDRLKIALSLKQAGDAGDPWLKVPEKYRVGTLIEGAIERKENYGLFVTLEPGITALLPRSKWRDSVDAKSFENKKKGERVQAMVDEISFEDKKITLGLPREVQDLSWQSHLGPKKGLGTFADLFNKKN